MIDIAGPAKEVFQILRSYNYSVVMYDDEGNQVYEPEDARRFFAKPKNILVTLVDEEEDSSIRLFTGNNVEAKDILGLITTLRVTATKYNMIFNSKSLGHEISPKDFASRASVAEQMEEAETMITEGMYGTTRSSYLKLENARLIVRHRGRIDENSHGARSRNIEQIFCENRLGERFLFPTPHLAPARAMAQHLNHGGGFADAVGEQIQRMANDYADLGRCARYVHGNRGALNESAQALREKCRGKMREMRRVFERLYRPSGYEAAASDLQERANALVEGEGSALMEKLKGVLAVEGVDLPENMLEGVCRAFGTEELEEAPRYKEGPTVSVLGKRVEKDAWEAFKNGQIDLLGQPKFAEKPQMSKGADARFYLMGEIIPLVKNDSLMNFLSYAADEYSVTHDKEMRKKLNQIIAHTLRSVGAPLTETEDGECDDCEIDEARQAMGEMLSVLGRRVSKDAWEAFKTGSLDVVPMHKGKHNPIPAANASPMDSLLFRLGELVPQVRDDGMMNLLSYIHEDLPETRDPEARKKMVMIAKHALKISGRNEPEVAAQNPVVQEYEEWVNHFSTDRILGEDGIGDGVAKDVVGSASLPLDSHMETGDEEVLDRLAAEFDVDDFLTSHGGDFDYHIPGKSDEELTWEKPYLYRSLVDYLTSRAEDEGASVDVETVAQTVWPQVEARLQADGYVIAEGDGRLTREDVLLPKDPDKDLKREVSSTAHGDDDDYVNRLQVLAGLTRPV